MENSSVTNINFWQALNAAAAAVQRAAHSETAVYQAFAEQLLHLDIHGAISMLDETGEMLTLTAVVLSEKLQKLIDQFTSGGRSTAVGYQHPLAAAPAIQQIIHTAEATFLADNSALILEMLPVITRPISRPILKAFGGLPMILVPLQQDGRVVGVMYAAGRVLTAQDILPLSAFANHLAIALENARLFQQMHRNKEDLRILAENVPGVIYQCENNYTFDMLYLNEAIETLTGYPKEMFLSRQISLRDLYHPDDSPHMQVADTKWPKDKSAFHHIYRIRHRSGSWRWVEEFGSSVFNSDGELLFLEGSISDITERKQAEVLQATLYRIATLANTALTLDQLYGAIHTILGDLMEVENFYISLVDEETGLLHLPYIVDQQDSYDGVPFDGKGGLTDYVIQTGRPQLFSRIELKRMVQAGTIRVIGTEPEVWLGAPLQAQSKRFGVIAVQSYRNASAYTGREKQLLYFVSGQIAVAIERKQSEEQLRAMAAEMTRQAKMFAEILSTTPDQFAVYDYDGRFTFISPAFLQVMNVTLEGVIGKTLAELAFLPPHIIAQANREREEVFQTGKLLHGEVTVPGDHGMRDIEYILSPVKDEEGRVTAVVSAARDITERNKTKAALHHAQKIESLGILAGGVAHDFNNLLVGMLAQTSLAQAKLPAEHPAVSHIQKAAKAAERAAGLTRQLLAYSGQGQFTAQPIHLNDLIQDNLHLLHVTIGSRVKLELRLAESLPLLEGDPGQMQQILMNLLLNSSEAIADHDGTITLTTSVYAITEIDERYWQVTNYPLLPGPYIRLEVQDDGPGMDAATLSRIFEPFFTTKFTGRGLGLAAVLGIVRGHEGGLYVASAPGKGTTIEILFPVAGEQVVTAVSAPPSATHSPGVVLVIDDEQPVREAVTDILAMEGIEVMTAATAQTGITLYQQHQSQITLVLLDLSLPDLRGEAVFARLQQINPHVRVILSSGYSESEAIQGFGNGLVAFLQKPYSLDTLVEVISQNLPIPEA
jgi:PAS domain S-box-containing protein